MRNYRKYFITTFLSFLIIPVYSQDFDVFVKIDDQLYSKLKPYGNVHQSANIEGASEIIEDNLGNIWFSSGLYTIGISDAHFAKMNIDTYKIQTYGHSSGLEGGFSEDIFMLMNYNKIDIVNDSTILFIY